MVHFPPSRWHGLKGFLERELAAACRARHYSAPHPVKISGDKFKTPGMIKPTQRLGVIRYLSKAMNPNEVFDAGVEMLSLAEFLGIKPKPHSPLPCKRVGWSENIGEKARKTAGWRDKGDILSLASALGRKARTLPSPVSELIPGIEYEVRAAVARELQRHFQSRF
jgi:hypothetical protein